MWTRDRAESDEILRLYRISFYASILLFFYGTLFPFHFNLSLPTIDAAWSNTDFIPYWDSDRGRIESVPDIVSNVLLTIPLGFFGFLLMRREADWRSCLLLGGLGLAFGCAVEVVQLVMPSRITGLTDALNNALGALIGAVLGLVLRRPVSALNTLLQRDGVQASSLLLSLVLVAYAIGPFDLTMDVSIIASGVRRFALNPWDVGRPISDEWVQMVLFALFGSAVGRLASSRRFVFWLSPVLGVTLAFLFPAFLEVSQLLVRSHAPSLRDISLGTLGVGLGLMTGLLRPGLIRPGAGLALLAIAIVAAGLSPYRFVSWELRGRLEWVPLVEYYYRTTPAALYDAGIGLLTFAVLAALLSATFRCSRWITVVSVASLATVVELAQTYVPGRSAGMTDIVIAALGGWAGYSVSISLQRHRHPPDSSDPNDDEYGTSDSLGQ